MNQSLEIFLYNNRINCFFAILGIAMIIVSLYVLRKGIKLKNKSKESYVILKPVMFIIFGFFLIPKDFLIEVLKRIF